LPAARTSAQFWYTTVELMLADAVGSVVFVSLGDDVGVDGSGEFGDASLSDGLCVGPCVGSSVGVCVGAAVVGEPSGPGVVSMPVVGVLSAPGGNELAALLPLKGLNITRLISTSRTAAAAPSLSTLGPPYRPNGPRTGYPS
jgi:hypothetical protein